MPARSTLQHKGLTTPAAATPAKAVKLADEGIVTAIVAVTNVTDAVDDLIVAGAFQHTLTVRNPKVVNDHQWAARAGRTLHCEEWLPGDKRLPKKTKEGRPWPAAAGALVATMQYNLDSEAGREAFSWVKFYAQSNEAEFSIGYRVPDGKARKRPDGVRVLLQVDLFEFSHVLFGAAPLSMALDVKSMEDDVKPVPADSEVEEDGELTEPLDDAELPDEPWDEGDDETPKRAKVECKTAASVVMEVKDSWAAHSGDIRPIKKWYNEGAKGQIAWGTPGDLTRCHAIAAKYLSDDDAWGFCNNRHHDALGTWNDPNEGKQLPVEQESKSMDQMKGSYEERSSMLGQAVRDVLAADKHAWTNVVATFDTEVIVTVYNDDSPNVSYVVPYTFTDEGVDLGAPSPVELSLVADAVETPDVDVEDVTVAGPMMGALDNAAAYAGMSGKSALAVRDHLLSLAESFEEKTAKPVDDEDDEEESGDPVEPDDDSTDESGETEDEADESDDDETDPDSEDDDDKKPWEKKDAEERVTLDPDEHMRNLSDLESFVSGETDN